MPPISTETLKDSEKRENAKTFDEFRKLQFDTWVIIIFDKKLLIHHYVHAHISSKITFASTPWVCLYD